MKLCFRVMKINRYLFILKGIGMLRNELGDNKGRTVYIDLVYEVNG